MRGFIEALRAFLARRAALMLLILVAIVVVVVLMVMLQSDDGDGDGEAGGDVPAGEPGDGDEDGEDGGDGEDGDDDGSEGDDGNSDDGSTGGDDGSGDGSDSDDDESSGGGSDGGTGDQPPPPPPPPGGLCGPQEFLGGLIPFVQALGDPDLLPWGDSWFDDIPSATAGPIAGPFGVISVPATVLGGFNQAYQPLADAIPDDCASISGDPHIRTIDQLSYDFMAVGEFWAIRSDDGSIEIQVRTEPVGDSRTVSSATGMATVIDGVQVVVDSNRAVPVTIDGDPVEEATHVVTPNDGIVIVLAENDGVAIYWPDQETTLAIPNPASPHLSINLSLNEDQKGSVSGLWGDGDGQPRNDVALPDGTVLGDDHEVIHGDFRDAWRIDEPEMLFDGPSVFDAEFPNERLRIGDTDGAARQACIDAGVLSGDLIENCVFDIVATGDDSFAAVYAEQQTPRVLARMPECAVALDGDVATAAFGPARTSAVTTAVAGTTELWRLDLGDDLEANAIRALPAGDRLIVLDADLGPLTLDGDGAVSQVAEVDPIPGVDPLVVGDTVFVATTEGLIAAGLDGEACWHLLVLPDEAVATLTWNGDRVIVTTEADSGEISTVFALDAATGEAVWSRTMDGTVSQFGADTPPALADGLLVMQRSGGVVALDPATGDEIWATDWERPNDTVTDLAIDGDVVLATSRQAGITALSTADGSVLWNQAPLSVSSGLTVSDDGIVVVDDESGMRGVDTATGDVLWENEEASLASSSPDTVLADGQLYAAIDTRVVGVIDISTGEIVDRIDADLGSGGANANNRWAATLVAWDSKLVVIDAGGELIAYG